MKAAMAKSLKYSVADQVNEYQQGSCEMAMKTLFYIL
jgi:hypothetical protein